MDQLLTELAINLTELAVKRTASSISTKIKAIHNNKNLDSVRNGYEEIISELISEREEAIRIAQIYKGELDRLQISDEDIKHLHETVTNVLTIFQSFSPSTNMAEFEKFKNLISMDTLKTMQLLGFNYKQAIGEPLTRICAEKISSWGKPVQSQKVAHKKNR
ncbi:hypothetical protein IBE11_03445 [Francisella tularensis subsp. novicida]|uniref:hypothetical protein n=1 Tax=Francisella tularensis TaxID=263 RepID=UPI000158ACC5|nr:hypothetical protein [Francisella tularensis]AJI46177.1 hypothetical protein AS84_729 [Francisella tularensis subsp. novicida F6168]AJJ47709.1 hypothetical protein CH70_145 [Francisella tularensis subsp. novicida]APC99429.1 hypothetical protein KX03_1826 [Francisella tularensis subsp. novicida]EDN35363.1 predicted protein [Francisella tularensis subsp. novicida GA99-3549]KFJ68673.1 hypothetical protein DR83_35 [Francisella tularensis subsp. novicida]